NRELRWQRNFFKTAFRAPSCCLLILGRAGDPSRIADRQRPQRQFDHFIFNRNFLCFGLAGSLRRKNCRGENHQPKENQGRRSESFRSRRSPEAEKLNFPNQRRIPAHFTVTWNTPEGIPVTAAVTVYFPVVAGVVYVV